MRFSLVLLLPACAYAQHATLPPPITSAERVHWVINSTVGPASLWGGLFSAGFGTLLDAPHEYGTHWDGAAKRYGMRLTGVATSNVMEAGIGSLWGEDPRYVKAASGSSFGHRVGHIAKWTFVAANRDGDPHPAYARFIAIAGSNALSNTWRADSEADTTHFVARTALGVALRMAGNTWEEFWPDAKRKLFHRDAKSGTP
ncbi:MAG TPA: hypothetical protein VHB50_01875 [Bryobacteraceae bacterium]|nr:hypothetical protein [Bryobacteraceae bacterium]